MSKKSPHIIKGFFILLFVLIQIYIGITNLLENSGFKGKGEMNFVLFIFYLILTVIGLLYCYFYLEMIFVSKDKIIAWNTFRKIATVASVKKSTPRRFKEKYVKMSDEDRRDLKKLPKFKINVRVNYSVEGINYSNIKLRFTVDTDEFEKFKDIKEVHILVNEKNYKDITIDWEWLGRDRIDLYD